MLAAITVDADWNFVKGLSQLLVVLTGKSCHAVLVSRLCWRYEWHSEVLIYKSELCAWFYS